MVAEEKGSISIHTENIFPIIKKFLYSDHEIFLRELVSNAVDATQKLKRLAAIGEYDGELGDPKVTVKLDAEAKTITISDEGIGMTADEIKKYINQIAFSGANEFVEKYKDQGDVRSQIIGNFGLGFYSAFMVSDLVEIQSLSHRAGSDAAHWTCDGSTEFSIDAGNRGVRGTDVVLHINEDSAEFLDEYRLRQILTKYCKFMPVAIFLGEEQINEVQPLWTRNHSELKDEDYLNFYKELYPMSPEPLFWIHLNVDYPFNLTGVLYFPKLRQNFDFEREKIQLYSRQVFITDDVKDVVPEFLMLLHGVIDSPDIPLNVSRSFLQADGNVKKINSHITKKVADKLQELFRNDREGYEAKWDSLGLFVKYGMVAEPKFLERAKEFALVKSLEPKLYTLTEYKDKVAPLQTDKDEKVVWLFANDADAQSMYVAQAQKRGYDVLLLDSVIDTHFISTIERELEKVSLKRVDADSIDKLIAKTEELATNLSDEQKETLTKAFQNVAGDDKLKVRIEALQSDDLPVTLILPEWSRRFREMSRTGGMMGMFPDQKETELVVNASHPLVNRLLDSNAEEQSKVSQQLYDLARLAQGELTGQALVQFVERSVAML